MLSIQEILLRVQADPDDAEEGLHDVAAELEAFDGMSAEADVELNTKAVRVELKEIERELRSLDGKSASPEVELDILDTEFELAALQRQLAALDRQDVDIDVEIREEINRDVDSLRARMAGLRTEFTDVAGEAEQLGGALGGGGGGLGGAMGDLSGRLGPLGSSMSAMGPIIAVLIPVVVSLGAAIAALIASFAAAAAGAAALGVAFGSLLLPGIALAAGAVQRFSATVDKAGSAAHALAGAAADVGAAFQRAVAPGADAVFRGMASGLRALLPTVRSLRGALTTLGQSVGGAFRTLGQELASPAWAGFFDMLATAAARVTPQLTSAFISLARILRDIATAAMPFLERGLKAIADGLRELSDSTDAKGLSSTIGTLVSHLGEWLRLGGEIGRVFLGFLKAAAPAGKDLVTSLADGAKALADWANSATGQEQIKAFFDDVIPLAKQVAELIGQIAVDFIEMGQKLAPILTPLVDAFGRLIDFTSKFSSNPLGALIGQFGDLKGIVSDLIGLIEALVGKLGDISLSSIFGGGGGSGGGLSFPNLANPISILTTGVKNLSAAWSELGGAFSGGTAGASAVAAALGGIKDAAAGAASSIGGGGGDSLTGAIPALANVTKGALGEAIPLFSRFRMEAFKAASETPGAVASGLRSGKGQITASARELMQGAISQARNIVPRLRAAGALGGRAFGQGVGQGRGAATQAGRQLGAGASAGARTGGRQMQPAGRTTGGLFARAVEAIRGNATGAGRSLGVGASAGARAGGRGMDPAGREGGGHFATGLRSTVGQAASAAQAITAIAIAAFTSVAAQAVGAGAAMGANFAAGIRSQVGAVAAAAQQLAAAARAQLPGSEPKDHSSPLYGLGDAGRALAENFAAGIVAGKSTATDAATALAGSIRSALAQNLGSLPTSILKGAGGFLAQIIGLGPAVRDALGESLNLDKLVAGIGRAVKKVRELGRELKANARDQRKVQRALGREDLGSKRLAKLQEELNSGKLDEKERKALEQKIKRLTDARRDKLKGRLDGLRGDGRDLTDALKGQKGKLSDARAQLAEALHEVLGNALSGAASGLESLKTLQADLGETIKRIFAEGASGAFGTNAARSGDLQGSIVSGLGTQSWLEQLVAEIQGQAGATIDQVLAQLDLAGGAAGFARDDGGQYVSNGDVYNAPVSDTQNFIINTTRTGGEVDPQVAIHQIARAQRKAGRSARR